MSGSSFPSYLRFMMLAYFQPWERGQGTKCVFGRFAYGWDLVPCGESVILDSMQFRNPLYITNIIIYHNQMKV